MQSRHRQDGLSAARNYQEFFRGKSTDGADVAGIELNETLALLRAWVLAHKKK